MSRSRSRSIFAVPSFRAVGGTLSVILAFSAFAQTGAQTPATASSGTVRSMRAARLAGKITLDGKLDEAVWAAAQPAENFTQSYPDEGAPPTQKTEVRVLYDDDALYVGAHMFDTHPDSIAAQLARRDATGIYSDWLHVVIDTYHDRRSAFRFSVNPRAVQKDVLHTDDRNEDLNWDAVWQVATSVDSTGWTAEIRIPFSQLRFGGAAKGQERLWGMQIQRDIARRDERDSWSPWTRRSPGYVSLFGDLVGVSDIPMPRRLEILPYVSSKLTREPGTGSNPFYRPNDARQSIGADLKYGLPGGLTLSATVNPDFGQVEVDPAVVNLSAFETSFPEKRPFFVEGAGLFSFGGLRGGPSYGGQTLFYSRRIGRQPQRFVNALYVDAPDATTILGATKVSGKTHGWTVAVLDAVTAEERARFVGSNGNSTGVPETSPVEPATNYFVGRVKKDLRGGNTILGAGATVVNRNVGNPVFTDLLRARADVGELDFEQRWGNRNYALTGAFAGSSVGGSKAVITNTQRASARYYQRPDADYLAVDPNRTSLTGYSLGLGFQKSGTVTVSSTLKEVSPGFEVNDAGIMGRVDYRNFGISTTYNQFKPGKHLRSWDIGVGTNHAWNFGGDKIRTSFFQYGGITLKNLWSLGGGLEYDPSNLDDRLTRGGPLGRQFTQYGAYTYGTTDARRRVAYNWNTNYFADPDGGYSKSFSVGLDVRPSSSIRVTLSPGITLGRNTVQFLRSQTDTTAAATFGRRYIFSDLYQTTLSATTRIEWTASPTLSLQLYAQPFTSAGDYRALKELAKPGTTRYTVYGRDGGSTLAETRDAQARATGYTIDPDGGGAAVPFTLTNPDFNFHSLRGNAVVRWEYRPGSAVFFVWQQSRAENEFDGNFDFARDTRAIFGRPTNVFLVKATYWFAR